MIASDSGDRSYHARYHLTSSSLSLVFLAASFYGHSYLRLPLQEAKNSTQVEFRFKTHQQDAFLFLAAGSSDYCLIYLEKGQLAVTRSY